MLSTIALVLSTALPTAYQPVAMDRTPATQVVIVGNATFYDEFSVTSSGEAYDPKAFTAAVQLALRDKFGGVRSAPHYRPAYVIAEFGGKRAVIKINNVGTMKPGRLFDLSRAAMEYFGGIDKGLISNLKVTVLPLGRHYKLGPLTGEVEEIIVTRAPAPATSDVAPATAVAATPPASLDPKPLAIPVIGPAVEAVVDAIVPPAATEPNDHGHGH